jgi:PAS domain S-box-containing protein
MNFLKNTRISSIGWVFVFAMLATGGLFAASSLITIDSISTIKKTWDSFEESRSEKAAALSALRKEIGYGGMIHQFKNFVLRHDVDRIGIVNAKLGGAASAIARYRALDLNVAERGAIKDIQQMLASYGKALTLAADLVTQGKNQKEIDNLVRVDDTAAIQGLDMLDLEVTKISNTSALRPSKSQAVASLRKAMGYGGMIHNFKNMVLRHDHRTRDRTLQDIAAALSAINLYSERSLSDVERKALRNISGVVNAYKKALISIDTHDDQGRSAAAIDRVVKIDDTPALKGFDDLTREISHQNNIEAEKVNAALALVVSVIEAADLILLVIISLLIFTVLWLIRTMITRPIAHMTGVMTRLAAGDLELQVSGKKQTNEIGEMARAVEIFRNTAIDRKRGVQSLRDREQRMSAILNNVVDGIVTIDQKGIIETFNPAAEKIFGYKSYELIGKNVKNLMPEPYHSEHDGYLQNYQDTGKAKIIGIGQEVIGRRKDGSTFPMELSVSEMNVSGIQMFTGVARDITERRKVDQAKAEFVSTVSHELRTPLTSIKGSLGLIRSGALGELPDKLHSMLDIAYNNSERLVLLINDILDMEKIEAGKMTFNMQPIDIAALLDDAIEANKGYGVEHGATFVFTEGDKDITVLGDKDRLMQALTNLMSNAAKFSPDGDHVELSLSGDRDFIRLAVKDKGPGIPEEFRDSIFEKFSQADSSDTRKKGGTGLGLSITKAIVEKHGGTIDFKTVTGEGCTFYIDLPKLVEGRNILAPKEGEGGLYRVLICEDDPEIATILEQMLGYAGYQTRTAQDAAQTKRLLEEEDFDAMTLDLGLPDQSGISLLQELKANPKTADLPIIVVSATAMEGKQELNDDTIDIIDWVEKPFDAQLLIDQLGDAIKHPSGDKPRILHVEDDPSILEIVKTLVEKNADIVPAMTLAKAKMILQHETFDLVILDLTLPDGDGETLLPLLHKAGQPAIPVIIFSARDVSGETTDTINAALVKSQTSNEDLLSIINSTIKAAKGGD